MKTNLKSIFVVILGIITLASCKKAIDAPKSFHEEGQYKVFSIGTDTTATPWMFARTETVGLLLVEDDKLKAELMSYIPLPNGKGQYIVKMTNKQPYQVILRWVWEGLTIDQVTPGNDTLSGNQVVTFTLIGDSKPGRIKVKAEKSDNDAANSSTLILEISTTILPIKYISHTAKYNSETGDVTISFEIDDPTILDRFIIVKQIGNGEVKEIMSFKCDKKTKNYSIPIWEGIKK